MRAFAIWTTVCSATAVPMAGVAKAGGVMTDRYGQGVWTAWT
jgi:hypothetical protein